MSITSNALMQFRNPPLTPPHAEKVAKGTVNKKLLNACQGFEAVFITQMLNAMRKTVPQKGMLDGGIAQGIYKDMLYQQYADKMAKTANLGLARVLYNQLSGRPLESPIGHGV